MLMYLRMAYIEENMRLRHKARGLSEDAEEKKSGGQDDDLLKLPKLPPKKPQEEGSVTSSLSMLTAIPEVDLGME